MTIRAVFLDRDGTINVEKDYVHRVEDFEFIPGAIEGMRLLAQAGIEIIVVTNQAGIGRGMYTEADVAALHEHMAAELSRRGVKLGGIYFCPHHPEADCSCRKPKPGLLAEAIRERSLTAAEAILVGDKNSDIEAGRALGLTTFLVETGHGAREKRGTNATYVVQDLHDAAERIVIQNLDGARSR